MVEETHMKGLTGESKGLYAR